MNFKTLTLAAALAAAFAPAQAQVSDSVVRIGVLTDLSGTYSDLSGTGAVLATQMAIDDFIAKEKPAFKIEMVSADHQNKGDIVVQQGARMVREGQGRRGQRTGDDLDRAGGEKIAKEKNKHRADLGRGLDPHHQRGLQRRHRALDLRHLRGGQRHRQGGGQAGRQEAGSS